ncbi:hypothetical protein HNR39_000339 [Glaciimonas immobilis]|uniref:Uncharacterized protein n=1 Tax=Glaciimonas immobilis TaxID=728004 RepID=A0A840RPV2_9BURK|nr:hypothetical protein [Glaciimonas immobilis]
MSRVHVLWLLLSQVGIASLVKGVILFNRHQYHELLFLGCGIIWVTWVTHAVFKNWDLPGPFAYDEGENQVGRVAYCLVVVGAFFLVIFS